MILISGMAAYGIIRFDFKHRYQVFMFILSGMMLAPQCSLIPIYKLLSLVGLYNTRTGLLVPYIAYRIPFSFFLMWSFTAVMSARYIWNDFAFALVFTEGRKLQTVPLGIFAIRSTSQTQWGVLIAGLTLAALPMVIVYICLQRYFVDGMNSGAVKG